MNDDLISRQAAIFEVHRQLWYRMSQQGMKDRIDEWLENLPPAQQKTGRWKHVEIESNKSDTGYFMLPLCECSVCDIYVEQESNYCPHCGARMEGN